MTVDRTDDPFERTVATLLDAAFDDARWGDAFRAIDRLCALNGGQFTALGANRNGPPEVVFAACYIDGDPREEIVADWAANYMEFSENVPRIGRMPAWRLTHNEELFTPAEKRSSVMYNEFQPKYDCRDQMAVVVDRRSDDRPEDGCLFWTMANGESGWGADKLKRIRGLLPHIRQAVRVRQELVAAEAHSSADLSALMEDGPLGVLFLDRRGSIVSANRSAERMLAAGNGIYRWHGTLRASAPIDDTRIGRLVSGALPRFGRIPAGGYQSVRRSSGLPLIVHVHPVTPARADFGAERVAALVLVRDPDANRFDPQTVGDALGLTPAESRVAVLVGILIGAHVFNPFLALTQIPSDLAELLIGTELPRLGILAILLAAFIVLGTFLEGFAILVLTLPIVHPLIVELGYDPIWFGVLMVIVLEMGLISPPVGVNVFVVKGIAEDVPMRDIFIGILPFWGAMLVCMIVLVILPEIALFLPNRMIG